MAAISEGSIAPSTDSASTPVLVDLDNDGILDIVSGSGGGGLSYFHGSAPPQDGGEFEDYPLYEVTTGTSDPPDPFSGLSEGGLGFTSVVLEDVDLDGDLDAVVTSSESADSDLVIYNIGTPTDPNFVDVGDGSSEAPPDANLPLYQDDDDSTSLALPDGDESYSTALTGDDNSHWLWWVILVALLSTFIVFLLYYKFIAKKGFPAFGAKKAKTSDPTWI